MKGVFAAVATPMRDDLSVAPGAFAAHCRRLLDAGCVTARQARAVYDRFTAGEDASAEQAALTQVRASLDGFPAVPAMKAALRAQTGDDVWRNLRPPLDALDESQTRVLLAGLVGN